MGVVDIITLIEYKLLMSSDLPPGEPGRSEAAEQLIDVVRIETVFENREVLSAIAQRLMEEGLVTGYKIGTIEGGYYNRGRLRSRQHQYELRVLVPMSATQESLKIQSIMKEEIGRYWDKPFVYVDASKATEEDLSYIADAKNEHALYVRERRVKWTVGCVAFGLITALLAVLGKNFLDSRAQDIRRTELERIARDLSDLEGQISDDMLSIESLLTQEKPLTPLPNDMAAINGFVETQAALRHAREQREKVQHLLQVLEMDRKPPKESGGGSLPWRVRKNADSYVPRPHRPAHRSSED